MQGPSIACVYLMAQQQCTREVRIARHNRHASRARNVNKPTTKKDTKGLWAVSVIADRLQFVLESCMLENDEQQGSESQRHS